MARLWAHEAQRVYGDRLINENDQDRFSQMLLDTAKVQFSFFLFLCVCVCVPFVPTFHVLLRFLNHQCPSHSHSFPSSLLTFCLPNHSFSHRSSRRTSRTMV